MTDGIDYGALEDGKYVNYWDLDRTLQRAVRRAYHVDEFDWAESRLEAFDAIVRYAAIDEETALELLADR